MSGVRPRFAEIGGAGADSHSPAVDLERARDVGVSHLAGQVGDGTPARSDQYANVWRMLYGARY